MIALRLIFFSESSFLRNGSTLQSKYNVRLSPDIRVATWTYPKSTSGVLRRVRRVHDHCIFRLIIDNQVSIVVVTPGPFDIFSNAMPIPRQGLLLTHRDRFDMHSSEF